MCGIAGIYPNFFTQKSEDFLNKMPAFALEGITLFSIKPLRIVAVLGFLVFMASIFLGIFHYTLTFHLKLL